MKINNIWNQHLANHGSIHVLPSFQQDILPDAGRTGWKKGSAVPRIARLQRLCHLIHTLTWRRWPVTHGRGEKRQGHVYYSPENSRGNGKTTLLNHFKYMKLLKNNQWNEITYPYVEPMQSPHWHSTWKMVVGRRHVLLGKLIFRTYLILETFDEWICSSYVWLFWSILNIHVTLQGTSPHPTLG